MTARFKIARVDSGQKERENDMSRAVQPPRRRKALLVLLGALRGALECQVNSIDNRAVSIGIYAFPEFGDRNSLPA